MHEKLQIDLSGIIRRRVGGIKGKLIPGFLLKGLERLIRQKELNSILEDTYPKTGNEFARAVYRHLDITLETRGMERIPSSGRFLFASNHPLGGLDGIGLIAVLGEKYGDEGFRFPVNDLLLNVEPLRNVFLPVNKFGAQSRAGAKAMSEAYASDMQLIMFPAGLCSRLGDDGIVRDLIWQKSFVAKSIESGRLIVPVRFAGENSRRFYSIARWRKRLRIGFNIEQALLPAELCRARGKRFRIIFGDPVDPSALRRSGMSLADIALHIRNISDNLPDA